MITYTGRPTITDADIAAFLAEREVIVSRMGLKTTEEYLAGQGPVDPNPMAGTDWE